MYFLSSGEIFLDLHTIGSAIQSFPNISASVLNLRYSTTYLLQVDYQCIGTESEQAWKEHCLRSEVLYLKSRPVYTLPGGVAINNTNK
ncbi:hypothetical protein Y032_0010g1064 [Ancylostoma ceylanicum]|uniref:Uncharacterized protein n=1 Tax=Ancylostoma ceylanicum TaxID=53326 RepID=A0A016VG54_9BILA|nr:hypothetical protein Y032_0010g1064 [Ancylostoma ceylanicum]